MAPHATTWLWSIVASRTRIFLIAAQGDDERGGVGAGRLEQLVLVDVLAAGEVYERGSQVGAVGLELYYDADADAAADGGAESLGGGLKQLGYTTSRLA
jgi:hypothetical protein